MGEHAHTFEHYHADYCHRYESGEICACGEKQHVEARVRDFRSVNGGWWHWGREGCVHCEALMRDAGLDPAALGDDDLACREIDRQFALLGRHAMNERDELAVAVRLAAAVRLAVKRAVVGENDVVRVRLDDWSQIVRLASRNDPLPPELRGPLEARNG